MLRRRLAFASSLALAILCALVLYPQGANAQTTSFTYQGRLQDGGANASGSYDFQFTLWDSVAGGTQQPQPAPVTVTRSSVAVAGGIFAVQLDFGVNAFSGSERFLEISVRPAGGPSFNTLSPRQPISSTPYAIRTLNASTADGLSSVCVNCVQDSQINSVAGSKVSGAIPVADVPSGSSSYIQNSTTQQATSNFNISGDGTAAGTLSGNVVSATKYNFGPYSVLTGSAADSNYFLGLRAGLSNSGFDNSFFGDNAGCQNTSGHNNTVVGSFAGCELPNGNTTGNFITLSGAVSNTGQTNLSNATAIGAFARVDQSNSLVLGSVNGVNSAPASTNVGIGTTAPAATLNVVGPAGASNVDATTVLQVIGGKGGLLGRKGAGVLIQAGDGGDDVSVGGVGGSITLVPGSGGSGFVPGTRGAVDVTGNAVVRGLGTIANNLGAADLQVGYGLASPGTAGSVPRLALQPYGHTGGPWKFNARDDATKAYLDWVYGPAATGITQDSSGNVGIGTPSPDNKLTVNGSADKPGGGSWGIFSDERLKNIKGNFTPGLNAVMQLRPLRYEYKPDNALGIKSEGEHIGFSAQQVQSVIPEAVTKDDKGYLLVNNDPILWTMLNAIKEQQAQIEQLRTEVRRLRASAHRRTTRRRS